MVRPDVMAYMPHNEIAEKFGFNKKQAIAILEPYYEDRAKVLLDKLSPLSTEIPHVIQQAIHKLSIINFTAKRLGAHSRDIKQLTHVEKIENLTIKANFLDTNTWVGLDFDESESPISVAWVRTIEESDLLDLKNLAQNLADKILLKSSINQIVYEDYEKFVTRCDAMGLDHTKENEAEITKMWEVYNA